MSLYNTMKRDSNIELLKIFSMFLVCLVHAVGYRIERWDFWLANVSYVGVDIFVLISGYYGIRFRLSKVLSLELTGLLVAFCVDLIQKNGRLSLYEVLNIFKGYWFLHAYVLMMFFAPLFEEYKENRKLVPIALVVFCWSFLTMIPGVQKFIPRTVGLDPYGGVVLLGIYVIGRMYRWSDIEKRINCTIAVGVILFGLFFASLWFGFLARYNSPFLLIAAVGVFYLFKMLSLPKLVENAVALITPSIFCIYLFHVTPLGYKIFAMIEDSLSRAGCCRYCIFVANASAIFVLGFLFDIPRRLICLFLTRKFGLSFSFIDDIYEKVVSR